MKQTFMKEMTKVMGCEYEQFRGIKDQRPKYFAESMKHVLDNALDEECRQYIVTSLIRVNAAKKGSSDNMTKPECEPNPAEDASAKTDEASASTAPVFDQRSRRALAVLWHEVQLLIAVESAAGLY